MSGYYTRAEREAQDEIQMHTEFGRRSMIDGEPDHMKFIFIFSPSHIWFEDDSSDEDYHPPDEPEPVISARVEYIADLGGYMHGHDFDYRFDNLIIPERHKA